MVTVMKSIMAALWIMSASLLKADSKTQTLLDQLGRAQSMDQANPIVQELWKEWTAAHKNEKEKTLMAEGIAAMSKGNLDRAENLFTKLIEINPDFTEAWNKRATLRFMAWDFEGSLKDVEKVLALEPRHFGALSGQALNYIELNQYEKAIQSYKAAQKIYPLLDSAAKMIPELQDLLDDQAI